GESRLLLCITLEARQVGMPTLHQALQALRSARSEVLAA
ncbi:type III secretion chaperone SycN, partial [Pseudomonas aeruginosa]